MGRVRILSPAVADRIAAGEVIERPASVVRELADNAIDAGAGRIEIDLRRGGIDEVVVADDGSGIDPEDAPLVLARHATSKLDGASGLERIETLGFRGEALAAIASVARVEILSSSSDAGGAVRVVSEPGSEPRILRATRARGTTVAVGGLFERVPARRKFLKTPATELDHCQRAVVRAALARPEIGVRLRHEGRVLLRAAAGSDPRTRIGELIGRRWAEGLIPVRDEAAGLRLEGWLGPAATSRTTREAVHLFVDRRPVRDPLLMRALLDAYRPVLPSGRFPVAVLWLELPAGEVDVNVHPAKSEVRFARPREVRALVYGAVARALGGRAAVAGLAAGRGPAVSEGRAAYADAAPPSNERVPPRPPAAGAAATRVGPSLPGLDAASGPRVLGQYDHTFIVVEDADGLLVLDQHAAHERVLYERLVDQARQGDLPSQGLLFPESVELGPARLELLAAHGAVIGRLGFEAEPNGPASVVVRRVPAVFGREASPETLVDLLDDLARGDEPSVEDAFHRLIATVACHAAVRAGMPLGRDAMEYIARALPRCRVPTHCPHGRVAAVDIDLARLRRSFDRCGATGR